MRFSVCLIKRNNKVNISINVKKKLIRENIYSNSSNKIIYQEVIRCLNIEEAISLYYDEIYKFIYLGYCVAGPCSNGQIILLDTYREKQTS